MHAGRYKMMVEFKNHVRKLNNTSIENSKQADSRNTTFKILNFTWWRYRSNKIFYFFINCHISQMQEIYQGLVLEI